MERIKSLQKNNHNNKGVQTKYVNVTQIFDEST